MIVSFLFFVIIKSEEKRRSDEINVKNFSFWAPKP